MERTRSDLCIRTSFSIDPDDSVCGNDEIVRPDSVAMRATVGMRGRIRIDVRCKYPEASDLIYEIDINAGPIPSTASGLIFLCLRKDPCVEFLSHCSGRKTIHRTVSNDFARGLENHASSSISSTRMSSRRDSASLRLRAQGNRAKIHLQIGFASLVGLRALGIHF